MPELFHFQQPLWFLALIPMALLLWWLPRTRRTGSEWRRACESHLLPYLLSKPGATSSQLPVWLFAAGCLLAVVALADPVWQKQPQPVYRNQDAVVLVLDLSRSMLSTDLPPSRLERARFKAAEILKQRKEGQTGLVVFAGDAFTVSPLTSDARTIQSLLKTLHPDLMPVQGSRADLGIRKAGEILRQAGVPRGNIVLIGDGYSDPRARDVASDLRRQGYRLSVLGVGSAEPAPIPDPQGGFVRDAQGKIVMPTLEVAQLQSLASAGGGHYHTITVNDTDLAHVLPASLQALDSRLESTEQSTDIWQSQGPWLVLVLLPLAALAFRRGWLLALPLVITVTLGSLPQPAMASTWDDLWQRHDQQAAQALQAGDAERARQLAEHPLLRGEAAYRAGDFAAALDAFSASDTAQGNYNRGNALAQLGRYQEAIAAYDEALTRDPALEDASHNKQELEKLLQQQQAENQKNGDSEDQADRQQADDQGNGDSEDRAEQQQAENQDGDASEDKADQQQADNQGDGDSEDRAEQQQAENPDAGASEDNADQQQADSQSNGDSEDRAKQQQAENPDGDASKENADQQSADNRDDGDSKGQADQQQAGAEQQHEQLSGADDTEPAPSASASADAPLNSIDAEQQQADERWLRRIPDDPGGLLRRKFLYQYSQRNTQPATAQQDW